MSIFSRGVFLTFLLLVSYQSTNSGKLLAFQLLAEPPTQGSAFYSHILTPAVYSTGVKGKFTSLEPLTSLTQVENEGQWIDVSESEYEYKADLTEVIRTEYYLLPGIRYEAATYHYKFTQNGYPEEYVITNSGEEIYRVEFNYAESGRIQSVIYYDSGAEISRTLFNYVTPDSIRLSFVLPDRTNNNSYFSQRDGNLYEGHVYGYHDRFTYIGITFDEYLKRLFDDFFFFETLNERKSIEAQTFDPYARNVLREHSGKVVEMKYELFQVNTSSWIPQYQELYEYEGDRITAVYSNDYLNGEWDPQERIFFGYGQLVSNENERELEEGRNFRLNQNYPNPFNPVTNISFRLVKPQFVDLRVYNVLGEEVAVLISGVKNAGHHDISFDASGLTSGIYYYRLRADGRIETRSMLLLK